MANIFENAFFGKVYKTRDGRKAIYLGSFYDDKHFPHKIAVENCGTYGYPDDGTYIKEHDYLDIVSEWSESIDEEKEQLKDELDALNMRYLSQVSLWKSRYNNLKEFLSKSVDEEELNRLAEVNNPYGHEKCIEDFLS